ncbi:MAG: alanine--tRNA ligase [Patescibacteria group bacterium]
MNSEEIRQGFLTFFEKRGHKVIPSASLVPENDPSVLFTTAGMQQFKPYYLGVKDPMIDFGSKNTASVQKSVRTSDIEEVGDERHLTFFEMLGNFSFGGYWKEEAIKYAYEFITEDMRLDIDYVTVFEGETGVPEDKESEEIWKSINPDIVVKKFGRADNFWGPTGEEGPCGPTTEIYVNGIEIWNIVFNEFYQNKDKTLRPLDIKGIDTGMGLERLAMVSQNVSNIFDTDLFPSHPSIREERIIADHIRTATFMIADGVVPSNTDRGYILRRLIRRAHRYANILGFKSGNYLKLIETVANKYQTVYSNVLKNIRMIQEVYLSEVDKFEKTLNAGLKQFEKGLDPFILFTTYGFPFELTEELAREKGVKLDKKDFQKKFLEHQAISRAGSEQKFKGGLAGHSEMEVKYHTATHLLHQALREVLGGEVFQKGSNITPERLRFDFSFTRKMTDEEKEKVENLVNRQIEASLPVSFEDLSLEEAKKKGAIGLFEEKYGDKVRVYKIGPSTGSGQAFSLEFCGGPHVENTSILGTFKIVKEEAVSAGVRRIKAVLK